MLDSLQTIEMVERYAAGNYGSRLPIVAEYGSGAWLFDKESNKYLDFMTFYAVLSFGHRHPKLRRALLRQLDKLPICTQAIPTEPFALFYKSLVEFCGMDKVLNAVDGSGAVDRAIKLCRKWGHQILGVTENKAEIISCRGSFHGRTLGALSLMTNEHYKKGFGPYPQGFRHVEFGDHNDLARAINMDTVAFFVEPIQGEGGVIVPPCGYLYEISKLCRSKNILLVLDEIQTGFGRTGYDLACQYEGVQPDIFLFSKALGGGLLPISAVVTTESIMKVIGPGDDGSTFGGYPLGCAVAIEAIKLLKEERLSENAKILGACFLNELQSIISHNVVEVRGRGLMIGVELQNQSLAQRAQQELLYQGILCGLSHNVLRINPPLNITKKEIDWAMPKFKKVLQGG